MQAETAADANPAIVMDTTELILLSRQPIKWYLCIGSATRARWRLTQGSLSFIACLQVVQLDSVAPQAERAADAKSPSVVNVVELMAAVLEDSPSDRLTMLQTAGNTSVSWMHM